MSNNYDFVVSGAGLIGSITALQLSQKGYSCCLIEKNSLPEKGSCDNFSPLSLNYRSYLILKNYGLWDEISTYAHPIEEISLKSFNSLNRLSFNSKDIGLNVLGFVVDRRSLLSTFHKALAKRSNVKIIQNNSITNIEVSIENEKLFNLYLESNETLEPRFLIVSEGVDSKIKNILKIDSKIIDYSQTSYVFNAKASFKKNTAIQIFNKYGIFAGIPSDKNNFNLILSINSNYKDKIFENESPNINLLKSIFRGYVDNLHDLSFVSKYELVTSRANEIIKDNILLLGNSSQLLHPIGAQGFNLALRNVDDMINCILTDYSFKSLYSSIKSDRDSTFSNVDFATNILASNKIPSRILSLLAFNLLKSSSFIKSKFMESILGIKNYPYLSIGIKE